MKLSEIKTHLSKAVALQFGLIDGSFVPEHFHITEIGGITKQFIDCGGTMRQEKKISFQLLEGSDIGHRLLPEKLLAIIALSEKALHLDDAEIEVEYQSDTIGKYDLDFNGHHFILLPKQTACLAKESCGSPKEQNVSLNAKTACCTPDGGCC